MEDKWMDRIKFAIKFLLIALAVAVLVIAGTLFWRRASIKTGKQFSDSFQIGGQDPRAMNSCVERFRFWQTSHDDKPVKLSVTSSINESGMCNRRMARISTSRCTESYA